MEGLGLFVIDAVVFFAPKWVADWMDTEKMLLILMEEPTRKFFAVDPGEEEWKPYVLLGARPFSEVTALRVLVLGVLRIYNQENRCFNVFF